MFENSPGIDGEPIPEPLGMHPDAVTGSGFGIMIICPPAELLFVRWCWRNQCGGIYSVALKRWALSTPIAFEDFLEVLKTDGIVPIEMWDAWEVRRWIKACRMAIGEANGRH